MGEILFSIVRKFVKVTFPVAEDNSCSLWPRYQNILTPTVFKTRYNYTEESIYSGPLWFHKLRFGNKVGGSAWSQI